MSLRERSAYAALLLVTSVPLAWQSNARLNAACGPVDAGLMAAIKAVDETRPALERAWPTFGKELAFGVVRPDTASVVVGTASAPEGFEMLTCDGLPTELRGRTFYRLGPWPGHGRSLQPLIVSGRVVGISAGLQQSVAATADLLAHEGFHLMYQTAHFRGMERPLDRDLPASIAIDSAAAPSLAFELNGLARVLSHEDAESRRSGFMTFEKLRDLRYAKAAPVVAADERQMEYLEGTAEFVGLTAALAVRSGTDSAQIARSMRDTLSALLRGAAHECTSSECVRQLRPRTYYTGAAFASLLAERRTGWQRAVESGAYLDSLLR